MMRYVLLQTFMLICAWYTIYNLSKFALLIVTFAGKVRSNDYSPVLIADVEQKGVAEVQNKYRTFSKNLQLPRCNQDIKQAVLGHCKTYESCDNCNYRYSESVPMLYQERSSQYPNTSLCKRTTRSDCLLNDKNCRFSESVPLLHVETSVSQYTRTSFFEQMA